MLKLRNRIGAKAARRAAEPSGCGGPKDFRAAIIADTAPLRMTRAANAFALRAAPGDKWDVRDLLREVGTERVCFGCRRPTHSLAIEPRDSLCEECMQDERHRVHYAATLSQFELHAIGWALGARLLGPADCLAAEILDCRAVLCSSCGSRAYVFAEQASPYICGECTEVRAIFAAHRRSE
jgi:hypothetical protein